MFDKRESGQFHWLITPAIVTDLKYSPFMKSLRSRLQSIPNKMCGTCIRARVLLWSMLIYAVIPNCRCWTGFALKGCGGWHCRQFDSWTNFEDMQYGGGKITPSNTTNKKRQYLIKHTTWQNFFLYAGHMMEYKSNKDKQLTHHLPQWRLAWTLVLLAATSWAQLYQSHKLLPEPGWYIEVSMIQILSVGKEFWRHKHEKRASCVYRLVLPNNNKIWSPVQRKCSTV